MLNDSFSEGCIASSILVKTQIKRQQIMDFSGWPVYNSKKENKGKVTDRHCEGDADVFVIDDSWEVKVSDTEAVTWTLTPDERGAHIRLK